MHYLLVMISLLVLFGASGYGLVFALINGHMFVALAALSIGGGAVATKTLDIIIKDWKIYK